MEAVAKGQLIQWFLARKVVKQKEVLDLISRNFPHESPDKIFCSLRDSLHPYHLSIKKQPCTTNSSEWQWLLYNIVEDDISRLATIYSPNEIDCFKALVIIISAIGYEAYRYDL